jgi:hypothetical protein
VAAADGLRAERGLNAGSSVTSRRKAASWLREVLVGWRDGLKSGIEKPARVRKILARVKRTPVFVKLRDPDLLARLPPAEQEAWGELWAILDRLLESPGR